MAVRFILLFCFLVLYDTKAHVYAACPTDPTPDINSPKLPVDVCIPDDFSGTDEDKIKYFAHFSWQSFIALVWPARAGHRGQPDVSKKVLGKKYDADPSVFLTYKSPWEVFHKDQSAPKPWNTYEKAHYNVCNIKPDFGDVILAPVSKFVDVGQADLLGNLVGPLVAQNGTYVRYLTAFNKTIFNQIRGSKLYLRANTPSKGLTFNDGSLNIKSA